MELFAHTAYVLLCEMLKSLCIYLTLLKYIYIIISQILSPEILFDKMESNTSENGTSVYEPYINNAVMSQI
jgi:hypothetical protein